MDGPLHTQMIICAGSLVYVRVDSGRNEQARI